MARARAVGKRAFILVAVFGVSFATAAVVSSHLLQSRVMGAASRTTTPWAYSGAPLATLPSALNIRRLVALTDPTAVTRWAPVLQATVARSVPSPKGARRRRAPRPHL